MIRNKRRTSKFVSALSAVIAVAMLGTTVFASGVLSDLATDDYTIEITNNCEKIELTNKPFIENGEVYLPLREIFEKLNVINDIKWDNGKIDISLALPIDLYQNNEIIDASKVEFLYEIQIGSDNMVVNPNSESAYTSYAADMLNVPVLKNDKTYITYDYMDYMLGGGAYLDKHNIIYSVYDKSGNLIDRSRNGLSVGKIIVDENNAVVYYGENLKNPESTITSFFEAFSDSNFTLMKNYCTAKCQSAFFGDGYCFGMTKASLQSVSKNNDDLEMNEFTADKWSAMVDVNMTPHEQSVFDPRDTSTSFYVILQRQSDGRYLIDEFATGL